MSFEHQQQQHPLTVVDRSQRSLLSRYLVGDDDNDDGNNNEDDDEDGVEERLEIVRQPDTSSSHIVQQNTLTRFQRGRLTASKSCDFYDRSSKSRSKLDSEESENQQTSATPATSQWLDDTVLPSNSSPRRAHYRIAFEIIRAKIISSKPDNTTGASSSPFIAESRYVLYTILIKRVPGLETHPAVIDRRYSDFHFFNTSLNRRFKTSMAGVVFPRKQLLGNFTPEVIARRSEQFQQFLVHCYSEPQIRESREFAAFLFHPELIETKRLLKSIHLEEAAAIFENVHYILEKISSFPGQCLHVLACLIGCLNAVDNQLDAAKFSRRAIEMLDCQPQRTGASGAVVDVLQVSELVLPLILLVLRQNWVVGDDRRRLEMRRDAICAARSLPRSPDSHPTLLECILKKDFNPILL